MRSPSPTAGSRTRSTPTRRCAAASTSPTAASCTPASPRRSRPESENPRASAHRDRVEDQRQRVAERRLAIEDIGAEPPVAERAENRAQDEVRQGVAREIAADLPARLSELDERLDQLVRRFDRQTLGARPHLQQGAARDLATPPFPAHHLVEDLVQRIVKRRVRDQVGQHLADAPQAAQAVLEQQIFLAVEVEVEGALRDAGGGADRVDGRLVDALLQEEPVRRVAERRPRVLAALRLRPGHARGTFSRRAARYFVVLSHDGNYLYYRL